MLKGHIFSSQLFANNIAGLVNNAFANEKDGVFKNFKNAMEVTYSDHSVTVNSGACLIQGRPVEEDSTTTIDAGIETAFCKLVVEIDLSKTNTENDFEQGFYNIVKGSSAYPELTQEDTLGGTGKYQFELARFKISNGAIAEFEDKRVFIEDTKVVKIFDGTIRKGNSGNVSEAITNFKFLFIKLRNSATYCVVPIIPNTSILRGQNSYGGTSGIELFNVTGTYSNRGMTFNLIEIKDLLITSSGITDQSANYTEVTEIYGVN